MTQPVDTKRPPRPIYLDWNATTPPHSSVVAAMLEAVEDTWGNPSSVHHVGRYAKERIEKVRARIARICSVHPRDLLFTSGGTEANNLALFDAPGIITSRLEHPSVTRVAEALQCEGKPVQWLPVTRQGQVELAPLDAMLEGMPEGTRVAVQAANHETGVIQPLEALANITARHHAYLHVDAVQVAGKLAPERWLHGDSFAIAAHKFRGPKGIGALLWRCGRPAPKPLLRGGAQQRGFRPGTLDPISILGFGAAWERALVAPTQFATIAVLRNRLEAALADVTESNVPCATTDVDSNFRLGHVTSLYVPGWRGEELVAALDLEGVCISSGSACSAGTAEASPVITAMCGRERAKNTVRISLGDSTSESDIEYTIDTLRRVLTRG